MVNTLMDPMITLDLPPYVQVRESKRARRLALRLDASARLFHLVLPRGVSGVKAQMFADAHDDWMREKLEDLPQLIYLEDGATIPVFGQDRRIDLSLDPTVKRISITLNSHQILVRAPHADIGPRLLRFIKDQARDRLTALAHDKAAQIGKGIHSIQIRDPKTRWGSCSHDGRLSFSWRLIFAPWAAFDYVVAHEVAHLKHLNHSAKFWRVCEDLSEDYQRGFDWMKHNAFELMRYRV